MILLKEHIITDILIIVMIMAGVFCSVLCYQKEDTTRYNKARMLLADTMQSLQEKGLDEMTSPMECEYPYAVLDMKGTVTYSFGDTGTRVGEQVNLTDKLQMNYDFRSMNGTVEVPFLVYKEGMLSCFVLFYIPQSKLMVTSWIRRVLDVFFPVLLSVALSIIVLSYKTFDFKRKIIRPVEKISRSSKAIIAGNYDISIRESESKKLLNNEIDELCCAFELLRDELQEKAVREEDLKREQRELISCISHDLKTPISTILAYGEGLRDGLATDDKKRLKYAQVICRKTETIAKMIDDLLQHSNAQLNQLKIVKKECYFAEYFESLWKELLIFAEHTGVNLVLNSDIPNPLIHMDEMRMTQVIYNLVENALKYMDKEKKEAQIIVTLQYREVKDEMVIMVQDNGSGIHIEDIPYVFDRFYRAEKSRSMSKPGFGLGLSICKHIVTQHGGTISCLSKEGAGTIFTISISGR